MSLLSVRVHGAREMMRLLQRRPGSFVLAVLLAAAALTIPLAGVSIARSVAPLTENVQLGPEVSLFMAPATQGSDIRKFQAQLSTAAGVRSVEWITREAALKALAQRSGHLGELKSNPLPDVLVVTFAAGIDTAARDAAIKQMRSLPRVEALVADTDWHRKLAALLRAAAQVGALAGVLATALLLLIVLGAVQLQLATSQAELRVLRMVGADRRFIIRPFAYAGALTLLCGALLATGVVWAGLQVLAAPLAELAQLYALPLALMPLPAQWLVGIAIAAALIGGMTAALGARLALRTRRSGTTPKSRSRTS